MYLLHFPTLSQEAARVSQIGILTKKPPRLRCDKNHEELIPTLRKTLRLLCTEDLHK